MTESQTTATGTPGAAFISDLIAQVIGHTALTELGSESSPRMALQSTEGADAGYVRLWQGPAASPIMRSMCARPPLP